MSELEDQLCAVVRQLRAAVDQVEDGVLILDGDLQAPAGPEVVFANRSFRDLCGASEGDLAGKRLSEIFPIQHLAAMVEFLSGVETGPARSFPALLKTSLNNRPVAVYRGNASVVLDESGHPVNFTMTMALCESSVSLGRDPVCDARNEGSNGQGLAAPGASETGEIMDLSRMESLALVAGGIAHDFNNVMTTVLANLSLAMPLVKEEQDLGGYIRQAAAASEGAKGLTRKLLSFARGGKPKKEPVDLGELAEEAVELSSCGSNVRCEVSVEDGLLAVDVDAVQIIQIFNNLLINARQAMPEGGVIHVTLRNLLVDEGDDPELAAGKYVLVSVRDRGCGIPDEKIAHIFEPFFTTKKNGSGLGLATCATVAREHGGLVRVRSKVGVGTEFRICLPSDGRLASDIQREEELGGVEAPTVATARHRCAILVVDDQEPVLDVACLILEKLGYEVERASSGQQAVDLVERLRGTQRRVEAVLMDMTLPGGMSGYESTSEILRMDPTARVIAMSGFFDDDAHETLHAQGFCGVLPKPFTIESLSRIVGEAVARPGPGVDAMGEGQARVA